MNCRLGATVRYSPWGELGNCDDEPNRSAFTQSRQPAVSRTSASCFTKASPHLLWNQPTRWGLVARGSRIGSQPNCLPYDMIMDDLIEYQPDIEDEDELRELADRYAVSLQAFTFRVRSVVEDVLF